MTGSEKEREREGGRGRERGRGGKRGRERERCLPGLEPGSLHGATIYWTETKSRQGVSGVGGNSFHQ